LAEPSMNSSPSPQLLALGSVNVDFEVRVERWPRPSETLIGRDLLMAGGGKAANIAVVARRLGVPALLLAHIGDDALADIALESLRTLGTDLSRTRRVTRQLTGVSQIWLASDGEQRIVLAPNANDAWTAEDADAVAEAIVRHRSRWWTRPVAVMPSPADWGSRSWRGATRSRRRDSPSPSRPWR
jgi:ribokinase